MCEELKLLLLNEIRKKKQIESLEISFINKRIEQFILTNGDIFKKLKTSFNKNKTQKLEKNKQFKQIVKAVKQEIGILYGSFLTSNFKKKEKILEKMQNTINEQKIEQLLILHKSTKERIKYYEEIYQKIFTWYMPKQIADIACGLNPISYPIIENQLKTKLKYFSSDINPKDMEFLNIFFKQFKINAKAVPYNVTDLTFLNNSEFKQCDLVFLFKALDSFEKIKKNISKDILNKIPAKHIVVSFPTKSLVSRQNFKIEKRNWLFNFIEKQSWKYEKFEVENELFILIEK